MRKQLAAVSLAAVLTGLAAAQPPAPSAAKFLFGHDVTVRPAGADVVDAKTPRFGVEVFQHEPTKAFLAISQVGAITVTTAEALGADKSRARIAAYDIAVRKAGEPEFTQATKKWGVELYRFPGVNRLLYATETGAIGFAAVPPGLSSEKGWKRSHGLDLKVREPNQTTFDTAKRFGVEAYLDQNTNGLLYVTQTGAAAAAPGTPLADGKKTLPPKALYGLVLPVRKAGEKEVTDKSPRIPIEVFEDPNAGVMLYITEAGFLATAPNKKPAEGQGLTPTRVPGAGVDVKARKAGDEDFENARKYGIEVFTDSRTGYLVFVCETGSIAVLPK
jgi:hypothetical protein